MSKCAVLFGCTAEDISIQSCEQAYQAILSDAADVLSSEEFRHLAEIADVGYTHTNQKDEYLDHLSDAVSDWVAEAHRAKFYCTQETLKLDLQMWYNAPKEVENQMQPKQDYKVIPAFYVYFGMITLALFCIFTTIFIFGICQNVFLINPVYLFMLSVGFLGLFATDITAIIEWRKGQNECEKRKS